MAGTVFCTFQLPETETIKQVKLRVWETSGMHRWNVQSLLHPSEGILDNEREVGQLGRPFDLQLVLCSLDYEKGACLLYTSPSPRD